MGENRPYLVLSRGQTALIVDVAVTAATEGKMANVHAEKREKYNPERTFILSAGYTTAESWVVWWL